MAAKLFPLWTLIMSLSRTIPTAFPFTETHFSNFISVTFRLVWLIFCVSYPLIFIRKSEHESLIHANLGSAKIIKFHAFFGASCGVVKFTLYCLACENHNVYILELLPDNVRVRQDIAQLIDLKQNQLSIRDRLWRYDCCCSSVNHRVQPTQLII